MSRAIVNSQRNSNLYLNTYFFKKYALKNIATHVTCTFTTKITIYKEQNGMSPQNN